VKYFGQTSLNKLYGLEKCCLAPIRFFSLFPFFCFMEVTARQMKEARRKNNIPM
jgi:hypothetical protein